MLGLYLLYAVLNFIPADEREQVWQYVLEASPWGLAASFVMGYLAIVSRGLRWLILLKPLGYQPKPWHSIHAVAFAYFANTFVPRSGELARCTALNQTDDIPVDELFGTVITERIIDTMILLLFFSVAVILNYDAILNLVEQASQFGTDESGGGTPWLLYGVIAIVVAILIIRFAFKERIWDPFWAKIKGFLMGMKKGLLSFRHIEKKGLFIFHTFFIWGMYFFMAYVVYKTTPLSNFMTVGECLFVMVAGGLGMIFPSPGGTGTYQFAVTQGFVALGRDKVIGVVLGNIIWVVQTVMIVVTGAIGYFALNYFKVKKDRAKNQG